jgi:dienelactone hydrolase/Tol biopolymer transport system component
MFSFMDGDTGSFTTYRCSGFQPFLPAMPCKVVGVGQAPQFAGTVHLTHAGPQRLMAYNSADGHVSIHFADPDVQTAQSISKSPIGIHGRFLETNIPNFAGAASLAILHDANLLLAFHRESHTLRAFRYKWDADYASDLIGAEIPVRFAMPEFATGIVALEGHNIIAFNAETDKYARLKVDVSDGKLTAYLSETQAYHTPGEGFATGHPCLIDTRHDCLMKSGCGWCVTQQKCLHQAQGRPCDGDCAYFCATDSVECMQADNAMKRVQPPAPVVQAPSNSSFASPRDVDSGEVRTRPPMYHNAVDHEKVMSGVVFDSPENNTVNAMNAGFDDPTTVERNRGCNDNEDKRIAREQVLGATDQMNAFKLHGRSENLGVLTNAMAPQTKPSMDFVGPDDEGAQIDFDTDLPLREGDGDHPVPHGSNGGRWGMDTVLTSPEAATDVEVRSKGDMPRLNSRFITPDAMKPMTDKRFKRIQKHLAKPESLTPPRMSTASHHDLMNGLQTEDTAMRTVDDMMFDGHEFRNENFHGRLLNPEVFHPREVPQPQQKPPSAVTGVIFVENVQPGDALHGIERSLLLSLAASAGVDVNTVQLFRVHRVDDTTTVRVEYTISGPDSDWARARLKYAMESGMFETQAKASGLPAGHELRMQVSRVTDVDINANQASEHEQLTRESMEGGCDEDGLDDDPSASNFMNGAALSRVPLRDEDGDRADMLVSLYTEKQLQAMPMAALRSLLASKSLPVSESTTREEAIDALHNLVSPVRTSDDAMDYSEGIAEQPIDSSADLGEVWEKVSAGGNAVHPVINSSTPGLQRVENEDRKKIVRDVEPTDEEMDPRHSETDPIIPPSARQHPSTVYNEYRPPTSVHEGGSFAVNEADGSINPIDPDLAVNIRGVPPAVDPYGSVVTDSDAKPPRDPEIVEGGQAPTAAEGEQGEHNADSDYSMPVRIVSLVEKDERSNVEDEDEDDKPACGDGSLLELGEGLKQVDTDFVFVREPETETASVSIEVDPLVEFRDVEDDGQSDDMMYGCRSTEDPYTGNSQPRIDYIGNGLIYHTQPLMATWAVYNATSGAVVESGELPTPYRPTRRASLGGADFRYLEQFPVTGVFNVKRCLTGKLEECERYAHGQWDTTIHTNDVFLSLDAHLTLVYNIDKGTWRVFNFDRDVMGPSDPFSTAVPPLAAGRFPGFEDDELVHLGNGLLMAHDPPTGRVKFYRFDAVHKTMVGPTHEGSLGVSSHRITGLADGRFVSFKPRHQTYRVYQCSETETRDVSCHLTAQHFLIASSRIDANPIMQQLLAMQRRAAVPQFTADSKYLVFEQGLAMRVRSEVEDLDGTALPAVEQVGQARIVRAVHTRPHHADDVVVTVGTTIQSLTDEVHPDSFASTLPSVHGAADTDVANQIILESADSSWTITNDTSRHHTVGAMSPDGRYLSYTATPNTAAADGSYAETEVYIVQLDGVKDGHAMPVLVKTYGAQVVLGPFSADSRHMVVGVETADVPLDNNLEVLDVMGGTSHMITLPDDPTQREPSHWALDAGAAFHGADLYVVSNEAADYYGLQRIPIDAPAQREFVLSLPEDVIGVAFDANFSRVAVSASLDGYADYHVYVMKPKVGGGFNFLEMKRPFLNSLRSTPSRMSMSPDGSTLAFAKETSLEPAQLYSVKIKEVDNSDPVTIRNETNPADPPKPLRKTNATLAATPPAPRLPLVSVPVRLTISAAELPRPIANLPLPRRMSYTADDGTTISGFVFPPSLATLYEDDIIPHLSNSTLKANATHRENRTLARNPPYIVWVDGTEKSPAAPTLWSQPGLQFLRTMGVGVFMPDVRGSTGHGRHFSLMAAHTKRANAVADLRAAKEFICKTLVSDCSSIGVGGWSYGGFLALDALGTFPSEWKFGIDVSGISNLNTFLSATKPPSRRPLYTREFGLSPEARAAVSPITNVRDITAPLLVMHGARDNIVPPSQSEEIVSAVRANHGIVKYLALYGEGHKVGGQPNRLLAASALANFVMMRCGMLDAVDDE